MTLRFPFFTSIRAKTSLLFFLVFLIVIVPVLFVIYSKVKSTLEEADRKELSFEAEKIKAQVKLDPLVIPLPPPGYSIKLQYYRDLFFEEIFSSPDFPNVPAENFLLETFEYDTTKVVNVSQKINASSDLILSLARSNTRLQDQVRNLSAYLFVASIAAIFIAGLLVYFAAGLMLKPIEKIISVTQGINASNSIERVPVPATRDESRRLAETINEMLSRIELTIHNQINFFASATHELKTPLAVMQTELSISLERTKDPEVRRILESQRMEVQRLDRIIQDFLLMSQLKSDSLNLRRKPEQLEEVVYAAMKNVKFLSQERHTQIQLTLGEHARTIDIDFDKMQTVFTNLLENAVKYSPENSVVQVIINDRHVNFINPIRALIPDILSLTDEFKKSEELSAGLGMGLWLCDQIVRLHGGAFALSQENSYFTASVEL